MTLHFDIREYDEVTSTNDVVKELALARESEGVVVCARSQTAGYGRRGNVWESAPGSLYMSLLLRPQSESAQIQTLPLVIAIAVRRALVSLLSDAAADVVQVKWPNDVVCQRDVPNGTFSSCSSAQQGNMCHLERPFGTFGTFRKICGISSELKHGAICVGIGVNIRKPEGREPQAEPDGEERNRPTYLSELLEDGACPSIEQVRNAVLAQFASVYESWQEFGFAPFRSEYMQHFALKGKTVRIEDALAFFGEGGTPVREVPCCAIKGVDDEGRLVASACDGGDMVKVTAGRVQMPHG